MPEDENDLKRINEINKAKVRRAFESHPLLIEMLQTAREQGRNDIVSKINIDEMVEEYTSRIDLRAALDTLAFEPNMDSVKEQIDGVRYEITKEENRFAFDENGGFDEQGTIEQATDMAYRNSPDYAFTTLTREEIEARTLLGVERDDIIQVLLSREPKYKDESIFIVNELSTTNRELLQEIMIGQISKGTMDDIKNRVDNVETDLENNGYIKEVSELELFNMINMINKLKKEGNKEKINEILDVIATMPETKKYLDPATGKPSIDRIIEAEERWQSKFLEKKRKEAFKSYTKEREKNHKWGDIEGNKKDEIFGAIIQTLRDPNASEDMVLTAQALLLDIAPGEPKVFEITTSADGIVRTKINEARILSIYNGMNIGRNVEQNNIELKIYNRYEDMENEMASRKLEGLMKYYEENGTLLSEEDYIRLQAEREQTKDELKTVRETLSDIKKAEAKVNLIASDPQKLLETRLQSAIIDFTDPTTREEMSYEKKVDCVIAAYRSLKKSTEFRVGMDLSNIEINKKALELLEKHIKNDPLTYGNYINEDKDGTKTIKTGNGNAKGSTLILSSAELDQMGREGNPYYNYVESLVAEARQTAKEEIVKDIGAKALLSRDGAETVAALLRDGFKHFVKTGMELVLGEEAAQTAIAAIQGNDSYKAARNGTYAVIGGTYRFVKAIVGVPMKYVALPLANRILPSSNRLAISAVDDRLTVDIKKLKETIDYEASTNFIDTKDELEFLKMAVQYKDLAPEEKDIAIKKLSKMEYAKKYVDPKTGEVDIGKLLTVGKDWEKTLVQQQRAKSFYEYNKARSNRREFSDLSDQEKLALIRSAVCTMEEENGDTNLKNMARAVFLDISPTLVKRQQGKKDKEVTFTINEKELMELYNQLSIVETKLGNPKEVVAALKNSEGRLATEKLARLSEDGKLISKEEYFGIQEQKKAAEKRTTRRLLGNRNSNDENLKRLSTPVKMIKPSEELQAQQNGNSIIRKDSAFEPLGEEYIQKTNAVSEAAAKQKTAVRQEEKALKVGVEVEGEVK